MSFCGDAFPLLAIAMNSQRIANGISKGNTKGNEIQATIMPAKTTQPSMTIPIPANTNNRMTAAQKQAINAATNPEAPIAPLSGPTTGSPLTTMEKESLQNRSPQEAIASNTNAIAIASVFDMMNSSGQDPSYSER